MSNELERVADAIESARLPSGGTILASRVQIEVLARAAIAAMTTPDVDVLAEVRALAADWHDALDGPGMGKPNEGDLLARLDALINREPTQ